MLVRGCAWILAEARQDQAREGLLRAIFDYKNREIALEIGIGQIFRKNSSNSVEFYAPNFAL